MGEVNKPNVFISYSWTSQEHQEKVKSWADRLISDGINVVMDIYDLQEGNDTVSYTHLTLPTN